MAALDQFFQTDIKPFKLPLTDLAAQLKRLFLFLTPQPLPDSCPSTAGLDQLQPGTLGMLVFGGDDFNNITVLNLMLELYQLAIDLGPGTTVTYCRMDGIGKINGC